jgi:hypothetical protein
MHAETVSKSCIFINYRETAERGRRETGEEQKPPQQKSLLYRKAFPAKETPLL